MTTSQPHPSERSITDIPAVFTIFGLTGDLAGKKIIPALWHLYREGRLPARLAVVGFARRQLSEEQLHTLIRESLAATHASGLDEASLESFAALFSYRSGSFETKEGFAPLANAIDAIDSRWGVCSHKLFFLAVAPASYRLIFERLAEARLNGPCDDGTWSRILIEKPFGHDLASAQELETLLRTYFKEEQLYRIDHYLFKEIIQGIHSFRFSNNLFEKNWDKDNIERIDVRLYETIGVENRGAFYDRVGTLRDVGQNHALAMLAAVTMDYSPAREGDTIRANRAAILETLEPWTPETIRRHTYRAQYDGYRSIAGVAPESRTETFFALKTTLRHPRWTGVPIHIEAGKKLGESRKEIVLTLKHPEGCLLCESGPHGPNKIAFRLEPNDEIIIDFWARRPGIEHALEERTISFFLYEKDTDAQYVEEYAKVIHAAIAGEQTSFSSAAEVEAMWRFADPVVQAWQADLVPLETYVPGTVPNSSLE